jgi:rhodanese-related sulfurtransferase
LLTVSVSPVSGGSVLVNDVEYTGSTRFPQYSNVKLEAIAGEGYEFSEWTGDLTGSENPEYLEMNCSKQVTANFLPLSASASIGNFVWEDKDADGVQDAGEYGINGVIVNLYDSVNNFIEATITSVVGFYSFTDLEPGSYYLEFIEYGGGYVFSPINQGNSDHVDSDVYLTGRTDIITLNHGETDWSWDVGMYKPTNINYTIQLSPGLNLFSLPLIPDVTNPLTALGGVTFGTVYQYRHPDGPPPHPAGDWAWYINGGTPQTGFEWSDGIGYWISISPADTLVINGRELVSGANSPPSYDVSEGWNLVGFKSTTPREPADYLESIDGKYNIIYGYADGSFFVVGTEGHELMQPGQGYWIDMTEPGTIIPPLEQIIGDITTIEAHDMIYAAPSNPGLFVLDVRTQAEYADGHIEDAVNLDYYSATFTQSLNNLDKTRTYIVYCRSGVRSSYALNIMKNLGFREAYNMLGGILQWIDDGFPVVS